MRLRFLMLLSFPGLLFPGCSNEFKNRLLEKVATLKEPFRVTGVSPADGATGVARNAAITVTFSEPIDANTVNSANLTVTTGVTPITGSVGVLGNTVTFTPTCGSPPCLAFNQPYTVRLAAGAKSLVGAALDGEFTAVFTVKGPLELVSRFPLNNATGIAKNTAISAQFNYNIDAATVIPANFSLSPSAGGNLSLAGNLVTFSPLANLDLWETYTVTIGANFKDTAGDVLGTNDVFSFSTRVYMSESGFDVSGATSQANGSGQHPSLVIDAANGKLLAVTCNDTAAGGRRPYLFRCDFDGTSVNQTSCTATNISAGQGANSGLNPFPVIDSGKLLVVATNGANSNKPSLFRCNLDGAGCEHIDISAGQGSDSGQYPTALVALGKLFVATVNGDNNGKLSLFRCDPNGNGADCEHKDISAGQLDYSVGPYPSAVFDAVNQQLLVVTRNYNNFDKPSLYRCSNLSGTIGSITCTHTDISAGQDSGSGYSAAAVATLTDRQLRVVTVNGANNYKPWLFSCNLDGVMTCAHSDISATHPGLGNGDRKVSPVIDTVNGRLLVAAANYTGPSSPDQLVIFICKADGTSCRYKIPNDFTPGTSPVSAAFHAPSERLIVATGSGFGIALPRLQFHY